MESASDLNDPTNKAQRIQELAQRPEFEAVVRETIQTLLPSFPLALPPRVSTPKRRKQQKPRGPRKDQRVRERSNEQIAKRHTQMLQRKSYVRASARAEAELKQKRTGGDVVALAMKRYKILCDKLNSVRLKELDERFAAMLQAEEEFPPPLPNVKDLYTDFYNEMTELTNNITCASCGCVDHHQDKFTSVPFNNGSLRHLRVDPSLVPFDFKSGIADLDKSHIMIDPNGIVDGTLLSICHSCQKSLKSNKLPRQSLANYRWIGAVPPQLQGLTWIEELLVARAHLTGRIVRLQNRNVSTHWSLKGHVILLPQDTTKLLDVLPLPPSSLPDIVRVVWVGKPVQNNDEFRNYFSVRTKKVYDALVWLTQNNEDYKEVTVDHSQFERWPPVWVAENLLDLVGTVEDGSWEDDARIGIATTDSDGVEMAPGDLPITASGIIDTGAVSQPPQVRTIQQVSLRKTDKTINVITGNNILNENDVPSYFTSAFPTLFPWGTGKHIDVRRSQEKKEKLEFKAWVQLLLKNSSR
jgi:hypothetical protein